MDPGYALELEAERMAAAFAFDPSRVVDVDEAELRADPTACHGQTLRVGATWDHRPEGSNVAGAWGKSPPEIAKPGQGSHLVTATGLWVYPRPPSGRARPGYGHHLGMSWGEFRLYDVVLG